MKILPTDFPASHYILRTAVQYSLLELLNERKLMAELITPRENVVIISYIGVLYNLYFITRGIKNTWLESLRLL